MSYEFAETTVDAGLDGTTGQPVVYIQATLRGTHLVQALTGALPPARDGFYAVPHDTGLDGPLCDLIDALIHLRYAHPQLMQLHLFAEVPQ